METRGEVEGEEADEVEAAHAQGHTMDVSCETSVPVVSPCLPARRLKIVDQMTSSLEREALHDEKTFWDQGSKPQYVPCPNPRTPPTLTTHEPR